MFGKGALILVMGVSLSLSIYQFKMGGAVLDSSDNFNRAYIETLVHESALSSMNMGINKVWNEDWNDGSFKLVANNCSTTVTATEIGLDTVRVKVVSWITAFNNIEKSGDLQLRDSVVAYFSYNTPISRFFWFTNDEGWVYWITGDSIWGPIHTNTILRTSGSPVFYGKATARDGIDPLPSESDANFYGGWEIGIDSSIPTDMTHLENAAIAGNGGAPVNTKAIYDTETTFDFQSDGSIIRTVGANPPDTVSVSNIAPNGVIKSSTDIRVKGVLNGQVTLYSEDDIWIDDDIVYADDPLSNPYSNDLLGLVADDKIYVTDNAANNADCHIQASMMAINGSFTAQNYASRIVAGKLHVTGSIVQNARGPIGTFNWWTQTIVSGFSKRYRFDNRLSGISPPYYPYVRQLALVGWWE